MNAQLAANIQRPNRWSNPTIFDNGAATGVAGVSNVARHISLNAATISNIRPNTTLITTLTGPTNVYTVGHYTYTVDFGCSNNHTFQWSTSSNGTNFTPVGDNATTYFQFFTPLTPNLLYIRCTVTGGDGQVSTSNYITYNNIPVPLTIPNGTLANQLLVYPNPSANETVISLEVDQEAPLQIQIISISGQLLQTQDLKAVQGINSFSLPTADLKPGLFSILINDGRKIRSTKLVKM